MRYMPEFSPVYKNEGATLHKVRPHLSSFSCCSKLPTTNRLLSKLYGLAAPWFIHSKAQQIYAACELGALLSHISRTDGQHFGIFVTQVIDAVKAF